MSEIELSAVMQNAIAAGALTGKEKILVLQDGQLRSIAASELEAILSSSSIVNNTTQNVSQTVVSARVYDITNNTADQFLAVGDVAIRDFTSTTAFDVKVGLTQGTYEMEIHPNMDLPASPSAGSAYLYPNRTATYDPAYGNVHSTLYLYGSSAGGSVITDAMSNTPGFYLAGAYFWGAAFTISTFTAHKAVAGFHRQKVSSTHYLVQSNSRWTDASTVWSSLGRITVANTMTGRVIIRRTS